MNWKRWVLVLLGVVMVLAIVLPSLLRYLVRGECCEASQIGDIRTVISAQNAYTSANGGLYEGRLACLSNPFTGCIPSYPSTSPTFLDSQLASLVTKGGYAHAFYPGPPPPAEEAGQEAGPVKTSPSSVTCFAYVAVPEKAGETGVRSFCGDCTGVMGFRRDGGVPAGVKAGRCELGSPQGWEVLQ